MESSSRITRTIPYLRNKEKLSLHKGKRIQLTSSKLEKVLNLVLKKTSKYRKSNQAEYNDYLVMEIFNRAMTNLLEKK